MKTIVVFAVLFLISVTVADEQEAAHRAHYVILSRLSYSSWESAQHTLEEIVSGRTTFLIAAQRQVMSTQLKTSPHTYSGELGLVTYEDLEPEVAEIAFDIRNPLATSPHDIQGPVCSPSGCHLVAVFSRFRRSFFSAAWWEAETFSKEKDLKFSQLLQQMEGDEARLLAGAIWPDEHVAFKRIKIQELRNDVRRLAQVDPSTVMPLRPKNCDLTKHKLVMEKRNAFFRLVPLTVIEQHPEIFAMPIDDIIATGWVPVEVLRDAGLVGDDGAVPSVLPALDQFVENEDASNPSRTETLPVEDL